MKMNILLPVFQLLYFVAHFLVSLLQAVHDTYTDVLQALIYKYHKICSSSALQIEELNSKGKLPGHVAVVFLPGKYSSSQLQQLIRVLAAFAEAGVQYLTAYDPAGKLGEQQEDVAQQLQKSLPGSCVVVLQMPINNLRRGHSAHLPEVRCREQPSLSNGDCAEPVLPNMIYLSIVSLDSGISHLTSCVQKLKNKQISALTSLAVNDLNLELAVRLAQSNHRSLVDTCPLQSLCDAADERANDSQDECGKVCHVKLRDPDVALVVGDYTSSGGFPPWQLRLAEFVRIPRLVRLTSAEISSILCAYAKIEQRYGR